MSSRLVYTHSHTHEVLSVQTISGLVFTQICSLRGRSPAQKLCWRGGLARRCEAITPLGLGKSSFILLCREPHVGSGTFGLQITHKLWHRGWVVHFLTFCHMPAGVPRPNDRVSVVAARVGELFLTTFLLHISQSRNACETSDRHAFSQSPKAPQRSVFVTLRKNTEATGEQEGPCCRRCSGARHSG
jgi:hypothetical protein